MERIYIEKLIRWLGPAMVILSFLFYSILMLVPFTTLSTENKILSSFVLVFLGEASFWIAVLILGRQAVSRYRNFDWRSKISEIFREKKEKKMNKRKK
jgi:hypothetical protein